MVRGGHWLRRDDLLETALPESGAHGHTPANPAATVCGYEHSVQFYEEDSALLTRVTEFAGAALSAGGPCLILATPEHKFAIARLLAAQGIDVMRVVSEGQMVQLDAAAACGVWRDGGASGSGRQRRRCNPLRAHVERAG